MCGETRRNTSVAVHVEGGRGEQVKRTEYIGLLPGVLAADMGRSPCRLLKQSKVRRSEQGDPACAVWMGVCEVETVGMETL